jgi:hypothetical protein
MSRTHLGSVGIVLLGAFGGCLRSDAQLDATFGTDGVAAGTDPRDDVTIGIAHDPKTDGTIVLADANDAVVENFSGVVLTLRRPSLYRLSR